MSIHEGTVENNNVNKTPVSEGRSVLSKILFQIVLNVVVMFALGLYAMNVWSQSVHTLELARQKLSLVEQARKNDGALYQYVYSGVNSDIEDFNSGRDHINSAVKDAPDLSDDPDVRRFVSVENEWNVKFAQPMIQKRHNMDFSKENISQNNMVIFYLNLRVEGQPEKLQSALNHLAGSANQKAAAASSDLAGSLDFAKYALIVLAIMNLFAGGGLWFTFKNEFPSSI